MEAVLQKLKRESGKLVALREACERTLSTVSLPDSESADTLSPISKATTLGKNVVWHQTDVLVPLTCAIQSKHPKLAALALDGIELLWSSVQMETYNHDSSLTPSLDCTSEDSSFSQNENPKKAQTDILNLLTSNWTFYLNSIEVLTKIIKLLLSVCCIMSAPISTDHLTSAVEMCIMVYTSTSHSTVQTACQVAVNQIAEALCSESKGDNGKYGQQEQTDGLERYVAVVVFVCRKILSARSSHNGKGRGHDVLESWLNFLGCLLTATPSVVAAQQVFTDLIKDTVCPMLVSLLKPAELVVSKKGLTGKMKSRASLQDTITPSCFQHCCLLSVELVRLVGPLTAVTSCLVSVFHQLFLAIPSAKRGPAIEYCLGKIFSSPSRLLDFCGPQKDHDDHHAHTDGDLDMLRQLLPGLVDTVKTGGHKCLYTAVQASVSLLTSLQQIVDVKDIDHEVLERLKKSSALLKDAGGLDVKVGHETTSTGVSGPVTGSPSKSNSADIASSVCQFIDSLAAVVPSLLESLSAHTVDEALQMFGSKFFLLSLSDDTATGRQSLFLNADSVYAAAYAVLMLNFQLLTSGFYVEAKTPAFMLQVQFAEQLINLSPGSCFPREWSDQVVNAVMNHNLLANAGWHGMTQDKGIVCSLIKQLMLLLELEAFESTSESSTNEADDIAKLFYQIAQGILDVSWRSILDILASPFQPAPESPSSFRISLGRLDSSSSLIPMCLEGLRQGVRLCCHLGMQNQCTVAFSLMVDVACSNQDREVRLSSSVALCMEALLDTAVQCASKSPDCWRHVFRCCQYICELEKGAFAAMQTPQSPTTVESTVTKLLLKSSGKESYNNELLEPLLVRSVLSLLTGMVELVYTQACDTLSWHELKSFVHSLCEFWKTESGQRKAHQSDTVASISGLQLRRIAQILTRCAMDEERPLLQLAILWHIASDTLVQAACHPDRQVARESVASLHDIISRILSTYKEKPGFGFQETMFRSLETLVALQLCDSDTEHQVVSSICDLVEGSAAEIRSGWQPVFGALRAVKQASKNATDQKQDRKSVTRDAVLEVVAAVLNHRDPAVFSQAAIPCVQCLIKLLLDEPVVVTQSKQSHGQLSEFDSGMTNVSDSSESELGESNTEEQTTLSVILEDLNRCSKALSTVFLMRVRPCFRGSERIRLPGNGLIGGELVAALDTESSGILIVWALLVNGLAETTPQCEGSLLNQVTSLLFKLLQALIDSPGLSFFAHILTSVLIPVLNSWAVRDSWDHRSASSFSHVAGQTMDLVAEQLPRLGESEDKIVIAVVPDLIEKIVELAGALILKENEKLTRVGCSTFRLLVGCCHNNLRELLLHAVCCGLAKALDDSLEPVKSLIDQYDPGDQNLKGKESNVKLVSRKNTPEAVVRRSLHLAEQMFIPTAMTASSRRKQVRLNVEDPMSEELSPSLTFVFSSTKKRISFGRLVVSLVSHRLLLQVIEDLLFPLAPLSVSPEASSTKSERTVDSSGQCVAVEFSEISCLIDCIMKSCRTAAAFDSRPALQVTVSKLAVMEPLLASLAKQAEIGIAIVMLVVKEATRLRMESSDQTHMQETFQKEVSQSCGESMSEPQVSASGQIKDLLSNIAPYLGRLCQVIFHQLIQLYQTIPSADTSPDNVNFGSLLPGWIQATGKIVDCINSLPPPVFQVMLGEIYAPMTDLMAVLQDENARKKVKAFFVKVGLHYHIC